ncbi:probable transcription factor At5g61620 [Lycium ferocissimum]|uniref:probable transcription factor At5g61620 n=1 Tax=Lycium ferocissimum TaxID=112874 RepID=UPI002814BB5C|nr:probable transcription factor At5g61620 [Lycium ferocissimum]
MGRNCTLCGRNGHNHRTCSEKGKCIKLFGVKISTTASNTAMSKKDYGRKIKKGIKWTEDEQRAFLKGLELHGKGNWAKICKDFLPNRTSTQIASHAQKYFMRLDASNERKNRKKPSVFDVHLEKSMNLEEITQDTTANTVVSEHAIAPGENNQERDKETPIAAISTSQVPSYLPNYMMKVPTHNVLPLTWVYMYPYGQYHHHNVHYASTSASATTFDKPLSGISSSSSKDNLELTL